MLIKVFGIWLMASNIQFIEPSGKDCKIFFNTNTGGDYGNQVRREIEGHGCDEVAAEINRQIEGK